MGRGPIKHYLLARGDRTLLWIKGSRINRVPLCNGPTILPSHLKHTDEYYIYITEQLPLPLPFEELLYLLLDCVDGPYGFDLLVVFRPRVQEVLEGEEV